MRDVGSDVAREQLADISRQRTELAERRQEIDRARQALAFDASTGDQAAGKKLAALLDEVVYIGHRADDLSAASTEAQRRVNAALEREARAETLARAREAADLMPSLRQAGSRAAVALDDFLAQFGDLIRISNEIRNLGIPGWPGRDLFRVACTNSLQSALHAHGMSTVALQLPAARRTLAQVLGSYCDVLEVNIGRATGQTEEAAE